MISTSGPGSAAAVAEANDRPVPDRLRAWDATESYNAWRAREAAWRDAADGDCLDLAEARKHALTAQADLEGDWPVLVTARDPEHPSHAGLCFDVRLRREGYIDLGYHAGESPGGRSSPLDTAADVAEPEAPSPSSPRRRRCVTGSSSSPPGRSR